MASILVFAEQRQGKLKKAALEALSEGRRQADACGASLEAVLVGTEVAVLAEVAHRHGADRVWLAEHADLAVYAAESYRDALMAAVKASNPSLVLLPATAMGLDLAPRLAARLGVGCLSDVVALRFDGTTVEGRRPVFAGKALATASLATRPGIVTLRPNVFLPAEAPRRSVSVPLEFVLSPPRARVVDVKAAEGGELDVAEAEIVVSGGRGLKGPENFALIAALAKSLGGAVGASRAAVDAGWIDHAHQVGQTGKTVAPKLYIACGISGAIQHLAGMSSSKVIVAINKDPEAPIFKHADFGIVGDLFEVVPALTAALQTYRAANQ